MKNILIGIVFLFGTVLGMLAATQVGEELVYKIPAKYLTFGRPAEIQATSKILHGKRPENGKILYITGGSSGFTSGNEHTLSAALTERLGVPVRVYNISSASQKMIESFSMIGKMPKATEKGQIYVMTTYGGHRATTVPNASLSGAFFRTRALLRHDELRDLINNHNLLEEPFMSNSGREVTDPKKYMAGLDKEYTSSVGSHWLKYFIHDKVRRMNRRKIHKSLFTDKDVYPEDDYSERRLNSTARIFANPNQQKRIEARHTRYSNALKNAIKDLTPEQIQQRKDFALYSLEKSKELSDTKNYKFGAIEIPIYSPLFYDPLIYEYRTTFNEQLRALSEEKNFPVFYLDDDIKDLEAINNWNDSGHMTNVGRHAFEKYYVDALVKFMSGDEGGVYGNVAIPSTQNETVSQD